jgi:hypothetical protein
MATALPPLPVHEEHEMHSQNLVADPSPVAATKRGLNPVLVVMLVALAVYPFVVGLLPESLRQFLAALFR